MTRLTADEIRAIINQIPAAHAGPVIPLLNHILSLQDELMEVHRCRLEAQMEVVDLKMANAMLAETVIALRVPVRSLN